MKDKKLILRVLSKLFAMFAVIAVIYVFMMGLLDSDHLEAEDKTVWLDVSAMTPQQVKYFDHGRRKLLVLYLAGEDYLVAYARDPVFACPIQWQQGRFISVCNGSEFGPDGKVYPGQATDEDLKLLDFSVEANERLKIFIQ